jgi:hypothetical protein
VPRHAPFLKNRSRCRFPKISHGSPNAAIVSIGASARRRFRKFPISSGFGESSQPKPLASSGLTDRSLNRIGNQVWPQRHRVHRENPETTPLSFLCALCASVAHLHLRHSSDITISAPRACAGRSMLDNPSRSSSA